MLYLDAGSLQESFLDPLVTKSNGEQRTHVSNRALAKKYDFRHNNGNIASYY